MGGVPRTGVTDPHRGEGDVGPRLVESRERKGDVGRKRVCVGNLEGDVRDTGARRSAGERTGRGVRLNHDGEAEAIDQV